MSVLGEECRSGFGSADWEMAYERCRVFQIRQRSEMKMCGSEDAVSWSVISFVVACM